MLETQIFLEQKVKLKKPLCIVGLPGIGNIGRIAAGYMVQQLKAKKIAELYSPYFFPFVMINDNTIHTLRNEIFLYKGKERDILFLIGDCQTYDPKGHYEIAHKLLEFLKNLGVKEIVTIGGFGTGRVTEHPEVYGVASDKEILKKYQKYKGINFNVEHKIGTIVGASGLLPGLGKMYGISGFVLLGETSGFPIITDPTAAESVLNILNEVFKLKVDLSKLQEKVEAMHNFIKKLEQIQTQAMAQIEKGKPGASKDNLKYIG